MKKRRFITSCLWCWILASETHIYCLHLVALSKVGPLLKNMIEKSCISFHVIKMLTSFPFLVWKCHYWPSIDEDYNLDIFEMIANTNEPTKKPINMEFLIYKRFQVDEKYFKCFFNGERNMNLCFLHLDSLLIKS
jgi:hypothetical protein